MDHHGAITRRLAAGMLAAALLGAGCERRPGDPKPPSDPGRNVPKPITGPASAAPR